MYIGQALPLLNVISLLVTTWFPKKTRSRM